MLSHSLTPRPPLQIYTRTNQEDARGCVCEKERERERVCVCVWETERESERAWNSVCACVWVHIYTSTHTYMHTHTCTQPRDNLPRRLQPQIYFLLRWSRKVSWLCFAHNAVAKVYHANSDFLVCARVCVCACARVWQDRRERERERAERAEREWVREKERECVLNI